MNKKYISSPNLLEERYGPIIKINLQEFKRKGFDAAMSNVTMKENRVSMLMVIDLTGKIMGFGNKAIQDIESENIATVKIYHDISDNMGPNTQLNWKLDMTSLEELKSAVGNQLEEIVTILNLTLKKQSD